MSAYVASPDAISERLRTSQEVGVTPLARMLFVGSSVAEMKEGIALFEQEVDRRGPRG